MPPITIFAAGQPRRLDLKPPVLLGAHRELGAANVLPQSQWREINRRIACPWIKNQGQHSSCTGNATAGAAERIKALAGGTHQDLSAAFIYAQVNGGQDDGASITDAVTALVNVGTCLSSEVTEDMILKSTIDLAVPQAYQTAQRFRATDTFRVNNFAEVMTALMMDYIVVLPIFVNPNNPESVTANGVLAAYPGQQANHAVHVDGAHRLPSGAWCADMPNSWGPSFGQGGRAYLFSDHTDHQPYFDALAIRGMADDELDPNNPPALT